jgi:hypothetical protein
VIEVVQGDDKDISFTLVDASKVPINLATGALLFITVKKKYEDLDASAVISDILTISAPSTGVGVWTLESADTLGLLGTYVMDLQYKTPAGKIYTVYRGDFVVLPQVTIRTTT